MKALFVCDNPRTRQLINDFVLTEDDEFRECDDCTNALAAYTGFQPDLVLIDWDMKSSNGLTVTKKIIAEFPDAKIVMLTNFDEPDLRQAAANAGAIDCISKENILELRKIRANLT